MANTKIQAAVNNGTNVATSTQPKTIQDYVKAMEGEIKKALPTVITAERFTRITLSAISANPQLAACTPKSFLGAMMQAAQLGLEANTPLGQAYLIPYSNHGTMECQFQLGYKGLVDLAYRSGEVALIQAHVVYENDEFECEYGLEPKLTHKPAAGDRGAAVSVYALFKTKDGGYGFEVMSMEECKRHADKFSKAAKYGSSPWTTNFEEMCKKTVLKRVLKYAPLKSEFVRGVSADETIKTEISEDMYAQPNEMVVEATYTETTNEGEKANE